MNPVHHILRLSSPRAFGCRVPPGLLGVALEQVEEAVRRSILMAFEGRSVLAGRTRAWLASACDVRLVDIEGDGDTLLHFEAPTFGEAAEDLYRQREIWPTRPQPTWTGFDVLAGVLDDVRAGNRDSDRFDRPLLQRVGQFGRVLRGGFDALRIEEHRASMPAEALLDATTVETAREMSAETPLAQAARVAGVLDMVRASTSSFALVLDDGQEIRGALTEGAIDAIKSLVNRRVLVHGRAVFRPSGRLLRIDAERIEGRDDAEKIWSKMPKPIFGRGRTGRPLRAPQTATTGLNAIFGKLPPDEGESEDEFLRALDELS